MKTTVTITGTGYYAAPNVVTNADLEKTLDTSDEWITSRTGIKERRLADPEQTTSDLALEASRKALADAGISPSELTHVIVPTFTPDYVTPSAACLLANKLGIKDCFSLDINAACSGFIYGLQVSRALITLEPSSKVLLAPAETLSSVVNWQDRNTCVLFGDGAAAAVLQAGDDQDAKGGSIGTIQDILLSSDGALGEILAVGGAGSLTRRKVGDAIPEEYFVTMKGQEVFKHAVRNMESISRKVLEKNGLSQKDVDLFIPHQANLRIIDAVGKKLGLDSDKVFVNVPRYGNTSGASVGIALAEAREMGRIKPGHTVLVGSFGAGFTWAAGIIQY
jgi:3-oxoacyl-[acyl-carrier-protein] synthase III